VCGVIIFLFDWAGYQGKFLPFGNPRSLAEIWWHFPAVVVLFFFLMLLWPWRRDSHDSIWRRRIPQVPGRQLRL